MMISHKRLLCTILTIILAVSFIIGSINLNKIYQFPCVLKEIYQFNCTSDGGHNININYMYITSTEVIINNVEYNATGTCTSTMKTCNDCEVQFVIDNRYDCTKLSEDNTYYFTPGKFKYSLHTELFMFCIIGSCVTILILIFLIKVYIYEHNKDYNCHFSIFYNSTSNENDHETDRLL